MSFDKWLVLDFETTGLRPASQHFILECGVIAVWAETLETMAEATCCVHQNAHEIYAKMDETCTELHRSTKLLEDLLVRGKGVDGHEGLDDYLCTFLEDEGFTKGEVILVGNTIDFDRGYAEAHLPEFSAWLHYRMVNVRSFQIAYKAWHGEGAPHEKPHRALPDAKASLETLRFFRDRLWK